MHAIKDLDDSSAFVLERRIIERDRSLRMLCVGLRFRVEVLLSTCVRIFVVLPFKGLEGTLTCLCFFLFLFV